MPYGISYVYLLTKLLVFRINIKGNFIYRVQTLIWQVSSFIKIKNYSKLKVYSVFAINNVLEDYETHCTLKTKKSVNVTQTLTT